MTMRLLVDAAHPEETRVVVINGNRLEDFDYASSTKTQLRGNIYLAKVTRVEPSLQAAFVDYGGNRHGFLAFSEIHPDYYQIPVADREALLAEEAAQQQAEAETESLDAESADDEDGADEPTDASSVDDEETQTDGDSDVASEATSDDTDKAEASASEGNGEDNDYSPTEPEVLSSDDEAEVARRRRARLVRSYKIQEVIKRRQVLLVQVVKEERGNKGAALTSYLSLAGRYGVLMPNTARGGGISRKIADSKDRKRLRQIVDDLEVPDGMGLIVRTAGANRNKSEIKRDYEFLMRTWDNVRDLTLKSTAPTMVYEEANLIKRAIRDLYSKDVEEVLVEGDEAYKAAKKFMRMLMPSHAKRVQPYRDRVPLFHRYQVEERFDAMHATDVRLKGGGYIVINPTEALVAVDVNSGKATRERNIEETALRTNLEAAEELARHLRLRDLGGLIVIDFIDMNENRHNRAVEHRLKESLKDDRARIQIGRISGFGLLEMSRQRMRPSLFEASSEACTHCHGVGSIRSRESTALHVLRAIETEGIRKSGGDLTVSVSTPVAIYLLNQKRSTVGEIEQRYELRVFIVGDDSLVPPDIRIERSGGTGGRAAASSEIATSDPSETTKTKSDREDGNDKTTRQEAATTEGEGDEDGQRGKRRRRGRRGGRRRKRAQNETTDEASSADQGTSASGVTENELPKSDESIPDSPQPKDDASPSDPGESKAETTIDANTDSADTRTEETVDGGGSKATVEDQVTAVLPSAEWHAAVPSDDDEGSTIPSGSHDDASGDADTAVMDDATTSTALAADASGTDDKPRKSRRGWWRRATE